jgi:hypothetical protein
MEPHVNERAARLVASGMTLTMFAIVTPIAIVSFMTLSLPLMMAFPSMAVFLAPASSLVAKLIFPAMQCAWICGTVGPILCLAVPEDSRASRTIFRCAGLSFSVFAANQAFAVLTLLMTWLIPELANSTFLAWASFAVPVATYLMMFASTVLFYWFLIKLAVYLRREDIVRLLKKPFHDAGVLLLSSPFFLLITVFFPILNYHAAYSGAILATIATLILVGVGLIDSMRFLRAVSFLRQATINWSKRTSVGNANKVAELSSLQSTPKNGTPNESGNKLESRWKTDLRTFLICAAVCNLIFWINESGSVMPFVSYDLRSLIILFSSMLWLLCMCFGYAGLVSIAGRTLDRVISRISAPHPKAHTISDSPPVEQKVPLWSMIVPACLMLGLIGINRSTPDADLQMAELDNYSTAQSMATPANQPQGAETPPMEDAFAATGNIPYEAPTAAIASDAVSGWDPPPLMAADLQPVSSEIRNAGFEAPVESDWLLSAYGMPPEEAYQLTSSNPAEGEHSLMLAVDQLEGSDVQCLQAVIVEPNTEYQFTGMIRTENVVIVQEGGSFGACLCIDGVGETAPIVGTTDWQRTSYTFNSGNRTEVKLGPRLGHNGSCCNGKAWFDALNLQPTSAQVADTTNASNPIDTRAAIRKVLEAGGSLDVAYTPSDQEQQIRTLNQLDDLEALEASDATIVAASFGKTADPEEGLKHLRGIQSIERLYVEDGQLTIDAFDAINSMTELKELFLNGCGYFDDDRLLRLTQLKKLENATFWYNNLGDRGIAHINAFPSLRHLTLAGGTYNGSGLRELAAMPGVEKLCFLQSAFNDDAIDSLKSFPNVQILNLGGTKISGNCFQKIAEMSKLTELDVWGVSANDDQLMQLDRLSHLTKLSIGDTDVSGKAIDSFAQRHPDCAVASDVMPAGDNPQGWSFKHDGHLKTNLKWDGVSPLTLESTVIPINFDRNLLGDLTDSGMGIGLSIVNERWTLALRTQTNWFEVISSERVKLRTQYHVAGTFDGKELVLFIDGKKVGSTPVDAPAPSENAFMIGALPDNNGNARNPFQGVVKSVRITDDIVYSDDYEIPARYAADSKTLLLLDLTETEPDVISDLSGRNVTIENIGASRLEAP